MLKLVINNIMFTVHVISDLDFGFNEPATEEELTIPDSADLVILNGNLGHPKRSMYHANQLSNRYPDVQFVFNDGELERYWGNMIKGSPREYDAAMKLRMTASSDWPKNLYWKDPEDEEALIITLRGGQKVSVYTDYGFPKINSVEGAWEDTYWYKNYCLVGEYIHKLDNWDVRPTEVDIVKQGVVPIWFTKEYMNDRFEKTQARIRKWELGLEEQGCYGILVTHINPYSDHRCEGCVTSSFNIHIKDKLWVTTGEPSRLNYLGGKLYSNSGRGKSIRSNVIEFGSN